MATKDSRNGRQDWETNPIIYGNDAALRQAVAPVLDWARLQKNIISKFNDKGRPENVTEWEDFQCVITQDGDRTRQATSSGDRSEAHFTVMYLAPAKLQIGNILWHRTFGKMKITGFNGLGAVGLLTARAVGLDATESIEDGDVIRPVQKDIY